MAEQEQGARPAGPAPIEDHKLDAAIGGGDVHIGSVDSKLTTQEGGTIEGGTLSRVIAGVVQSVRNQQSTQGRLREERRPR